MISRNFIDVLFIEHIVFHQVRSYPILLLSLRRRQAQEMLTNGDELQDRKVIYVEMGNVTQLNSW